MTFALGLVGCGGMGRRHVLGMKKLQQVGHMAFDLAAVCDILPENSGRMADHARNCWANDHNSSPILRR